MRKLILPIFIITAIFLTSIFVINRSIANAQSTDAEHSFSPTAGPTYTPSQTPTPTAYMPCSVPPPEPLLIDMYRSPTNVLTQTIYISLESDAAITVTGPLDTYTLDGSGSVEVDLEPDAVNRFVIEGYVPLVDYGDGCTRGPFNPSKTIDIVHRYDNTTPTVTPATPTVTLTPTSTPIPTLTPTPPNTATDIELLVLQQIEAEIECYMAQEVSVEDNVYVHGCAWSAGHSDSIYIERFADSATAATEFAARQENEETTTETFRCFPAFKKEIQQTPAALSTTFTWQVENWLIGVRSFHDTSLGSARSIGLSNRTYEAAISNQMFERCAGEPEPSPTPTRVPYLTPTPTSTPLIAEPTSTLVPPPTLVDPQLNAVNPNPATAGETVEIIGNGGYEYWPHVDIIKESTHEFDLYFDGEIVSTIRCYLDTCLGNLAIPENTTVGTHEISTQGGSTIQIDVVTNGEPTSPTVTVNHPNGAPGSVFLLEGSGFSPDQEIAVVITSMDQVFTIQTDSGGSFVLVLLTDELASGSYELSLPTMSGNGDVQGGAIAVTIGETLPHRERPATIADNAQEVDFAILASLNAPKVYLPFLQNSQ